MTILRIFKSILFLEKTFLNWGPGLHLHFGNMILNEKIETREFELIKRNPMKFLYGNIAPDITLGKKYIKEAEKHSHIWDTGFRVLENALDDKKKALAYGYLSHLASDIIAHNFFLPKQLVAGYGLRSVSHTILEIKADMLIYKDTEETIKKMVDEDFSSEDSYIRENVSKAVLPFGVNKKIFEYSLRSVKNKHFYNVFKFITNHDEWSKENKEYMKEYHVFAYNMILDIIKNGKNSMAVKYDPNGESNLSVLKELRKEYRILRKGFEEEGIDYRQNFYRMPDEIKNFKKIE